MKNNGISVKKNQQVNGPGLYKSGQVCNKCAIWLLVTLFVITCCCLDTQQAWSNATKCSQEKMTFADGGVEIFFKNSACDRNVMQLEFGPNTRVNWGACSPFVSIGLGKSIVLKNQQTQIQMSCPNLDTLPAFGWHGCVLCSLSYPSQFLLPSVTLRFAVIMYALT